MNNEFDNYDRALESVTAELNAWDAGLLKNIKLMNQSTDAKKIAAQILKDEEDRRKALTAQVKATANQLGTFAKSLTSSGSSFEPLAAAVDLMSEAIDGIASAFGPVGAIIGSLFNAAGKTTSFLIRAMDKAYTTFEKLSQSGVVSSFSDMQTQAAAAGLNLEDFQKVFSKNSKDLALLGGTATSGTKEIANLGTYSNQLRIQMQRLGISASDMVDLQTSALTQQAKAQGSMIKTNSDSVRITDEYISNLAAVSKLTGMSIKQLDDFNKQLQNSVEYRLGIQNDKSITAEGQKAIKFMLQSAQSADPALEKILEEALVTKGAMRSQEGSQFASMMGDKWPTFVRMLEDMKAGKVGGADATGKLARDMEIQMKEVQQRVSQNKNDPLYKQVTGILTFIDQNRTRTQKQYNDQLAAGETQKNETEGLNSQMADTKSEMYRASQQMEQLATNSDIVASLMESMAETMKDLTDAAYKMTGREKPESVKAQDEIVSLRKDLAAANRAMSVQEEYNKNNPGEFGTQTLMEQKRKKIEEIEAKIRAARQKQLDAEIKEKMRENVELERHASASMGTTGDTTGGTTGGTTGAPASPGATAAESAAVAQPAGVGTAGGANIKDVKPSVLSKLSQVSSAVGKKLFVTSGYRPGVQNHGSGDAVDLGFAPNILTETERNKLFVAAADAGFTGLGAEYRARGGAHIHLDTSPSHAPIMGWGSDERSSSTAQDSPFLAKLIEDRRNGRQTMPTARTGGIFSGPDTGYLTELHGDEIVAPTGEGVSKQPLNTNILQSQDSSDDMTELYESLSQKMEKLVDLLAHSVSNDKKQLRSSMA
jgi:hypothetical protein